MYTPGIISENRPAEPFPSATPEQLSAAGEPWARAPQLPTPAVPPPAAAPRRRRGRTAGALSVTGAVLFTAAYVGWNTWRASDDTSETIAQNITDRVFGTDAEGGTDGGTDVFTLAVGDCLAALPADVMSEVPTVPCSEPHAHEVYAAHDLPGTAYVGTTAVTAIADAQCLGSFAAFAGIDYFTSVLTYSYLYPTEESWAAGDRTVVCLVSDPTAPATTGSLAGTAR